MCFGLHHDAGLKKGQIGHIDGNRNNHAPANLVFLCLDHHDELDSITSQSKGLTRGEVRRFREELAQYVKTLQEVAPASIKPVSNSDILEAIFSELEQRADFLEKAGAATRPFVDDMSSHRRWKLRFRQEFDEVVLGGIFIEGNDYIFRTRKHHINYRSDRNETDSFYLPDIYPAYDAPATWIAAKGLMHIFPSDDGALIIFEHDRDDISNVHGPEFVEGHKARPIFGSFDVNSNRLLTCDEDGEIIIWDWDSRTVLHRVRTVLDRVVHGSFCHLDCRIIVNDSRGAFEILDPVTGRSLARSKLRIRGDNAHVKFSYCGAFIVGADETERHDVIDALGFEAVDEALWHCILCGNVVSDGKRTCVFNSASGILWLAQEARGGRENATLEVLPPTSKRATWMAVSADGSAVAAVIEKKELRIWERVEDI